jgi:hypothetical protein
VDGGGTCVFGGGVFLALGGVLLVYASSQSLQSFLSYTLILLRYRDRDGLIGVSVCHEQQQHSTSAAAAAAVQDSHLRRRVRMPPPANLCARARGWQAFQLCCAQTHTQSGGRDGRRIYTPPAWRAGGCGGLRGCDLRYLKLVFRQPRCIMVILSSTTHALGSSQTLRDGSQAQKKQQREGAAAARKLRKDSSVPGLDAGSGNLVGLAAAFYRCRRRRLQRRGAGRERKAAGEAAPPATAVAAAGLSTEPCICLDGSLMEGGCAVPYTCPAVYYASLAPEHSCGLCSRRNSTLTLKAATTDNRTRGPQVKEGALLCKIPKSAILSPRTTAIASLLEEERIGHGLVGPGSAAAGPVVFLSGAFAACGRRRRCRERSS